MLEQRQRKKGKQRYSPRLKYESFKKLILANSLGNEGKRIKPMVELNIHRTFPGLAL